MPPHVEIFNKNKPNPPNKVKNTTNIIISVLDSPNDCIKELDVVLIDGLEGIAEKFSVGTFFTLSRISKIICTLFIFG